MLYLRVGGLILIVALYVSAIAFVFELGDQYNELCPYTIIAATMAIIIGLSASPVAWHIVAFDERCSRQGLENVFKKPDPEAVKTIHETWKEVVRRTGLPKSKANIRVVRYQSINPWVAGNTVYVPDGIVQAKPSVMLDILLHEAGHLSAGHGRLSAFVFALSVAMKFVILAWIIPKSIFYVFSRLPIIMIVTLPIYMLLEFVEDLLEQMWESVPRDISWQGEYDADAYAVRHGAWYGLHEFLRINDSGPSWTHPSSEQRMKHLRYVKELIGSNKMQLVANIHGEFVSAKATA